MTENISFVPVIFGGFVNGYSLARSFYETYNIKSVVCDTQKNIAYYSKFCIFYVVENPNKDLKNFFIEVKDIGKSIRSDCKIPIILVTNDIWLIPLAKYKNELEDVYLYSFSGWEIIDKFVNKDKLYKICNFLKIQYPKTLYVDSINNFDFQNLCFPIIIKPSDTNEYSYYFPTKERNYIFENEEDAFSHIKLLFSSNYKGRIIIQEYIPGGAESLFTCTTYSNINGKIKAVSTGCKLSQYPSNAGTITSGLVKYNSEIITKTKTLLEANYYFGIANTEYKFDKRDNTYKLMEINARPGMWNYSSFLSGINIIKYLVDDLIYNKTLLYSESTEMLIWTRNIKKKIKINVNNYENKEIVKILLKEKKIFNPLNNKNDGLIFKIRYYLISIKEYLKFIINR